MTGRTVPFFTYYPRELHYRLLTEAILPTFDYLKEINAIRNGVFWQSFEKGDHIAAILSGVREISEGEIQDLVTNNIAPYLLKNPGVSVGKINSSDVFFMDFPPNSIIFNNHIRTANEINQINNCVTPQTERLLDNLIEIVKREGAWPSENAKIAALLIMTEIIKRVDPGGKADLEAMHRQMIIPAYYYDLNSSFYRRHMADADLIHAQAQSECLELRSTVNCTGIVRAVQALDLNDRSALLTFIQNALQLTCMILGVPNDDSIVVSRWLSHGTGTTRS